MEDDKSEFQPITADVEALVSDAEKKEYNRGLKEGEAKGFNKGYRECLGDVVERLKHKSEFNEGYRECIAEIERMMEH